MYELMNRLTGKVESIHNIFREIYFRRSPSINVSYMDLGINEIYIDETGFKYEVLVREDHGCPQSVGSNTRFIPYEVLEMTDEEIKNFFIDLKEKELKVLKDKEKRKEQEEKEKRRRMFEVLKEEFE